MLHHIAGVAVQHQICDRVVIPHSETAESCFKLPESLFGLRAHLCIARQLILLVTHVMIPAVFATKLARGMEGRTI
jgi:hypothetical protein